MASVAAYTEGVGVWFVSQNKDEGWFSGTIRSRKEAGNDVTLIFERSDGKEETQTVKKDGVDVPSLPLLRNPPLLEATDDLTNLSYLNEPSVLQNLRARYANHTVYTYSGIVLIAMNPFARIPLYTNESIQAYQGTRRGELEPHLFAIGEEAYSGMIRERGNQTVIVGAGKTVSAKFIMRYFASAGEKVITATGFSETEERIMATNPILESFGNAKTTRNDNSSRFGKYIELHFGPRNNIVGAKVKVYLLERSRLVFQPKTERNYHIFYQLCFGAPPNEKEQLKLKEVSDFHFTNQGGIPKVSGMDDVEEFRLTQEAFSMIGVSVQRQWDIFRILAGLLWLGESEIKAQGADKSVLSASDPGFVNMMELLQFDSSSFIKWTINKQLTVGKQKIVKPVNLKDAMAIRDSVGKFIYAKVFDWLIIMINNVLYDKQKAEVGNFIGVLDIYGFEHFDVNSFEQFCINYANEKLQQEFNRRVFKMEQDEYVAEKINWSFIEFSDNQACIEIIEGRVGVLSLLDEESRMPSGADSSFLNKLHTNFGNPKYEQYYKKPRFARTSFTFCHFAADVTYESEGFLDKNKDNVPDEVMDVIMKSKLEFLVEMIKLVEDDIHAKLAEDAAAAAASAPAKAPPKFGAKAGPTAQPKKPTLGSAFKTSLVELMQTINKTQVHYIRCIKPNMPKEAWKFEANMVLGQLRACGVLETIKISSKGYPTKRTLPEFVDRYRVLAPAENWRDGTDALVPMIIKIVGLTEDQFQIGSTKIFFRAGLLARMEQMRSDKLRRAVMMIQKYLVGNVTRKYVKQLKVCAIQIQKRFVAKRELQRLRHERDMKCANQIQSIWRMYKVKKAVKKDVSIVVKAQSFVRRFLVRKYMKTKRRDDAVLNIQRTARGWLKRKEYVKITKAGLLAQCLIRRRAAKKVYLNLKTEAKSASNLKYQLENKVVELTQNLQVQVQKNQEATETINGLESRLKQWQDKFNLLEDDNRVLSTRMVSSNSEKSDEVHILLSEKEALTTKLSQANEKKDTLEAQCENLNSKVSGLEEEVKKLKEEVNKSKEELVKRQEEVTRMQKEVTRMQKEGVVLANNKPPRIAADVSNGAKETSNIYVGSTAAAKTVEISLSPDGVNGEANGNKPAVPTVEAILVAKPASRRRPSSSMLGVVPAESNLYKRNTMSGTRLTSNQLRPRDTASSRQNRISMIMKQPSEPDREKLTALLSSPGFEHEVATGLVKNLSVPMADLKVKLQAREILFPSHLIGMIIAQMWSYNLYEPLKKMLWGSLKALQLQSTQFDIDYSYAFWFANILELLSIITNIETQMSRSEVSNVNEIRRTVTNVKVELRTLAGSICTGWIKILMGRINKLVIPAVVESQSLPGFVDQSQSSGFFGRMIGGDKSDLTVDNVLNFLTKLWKIIGFYYLDVEIGRGIILEILDNIGMTAFNHLLVRMQIQYNVTRIEEWCKTHNIPHASTNLEPLMQAAKLLQLQKKTAQDIDVMIEVCFLLNPQQMKKLLSIYSLSDYENPISSEFIRDVGNHTSSSSEQPIFLEIKSRLEDSKFTIGRPAVAVDNYLPSWLELPILREAIKIAAQ